MVKDALVSFWSSEVSMERKDFVGSGFFIAPGRVLTAAHVVDDPRPLWLRPEAGATQAYAVERSRVCKHGSLDVAIVPLPVMPAGAFSLRPWAGQGHPREIMLNGFFEGRKEEAHPYTVLSFDSVEQHYLLDSKQPEGQSGSAACVGDRVWGITVCHYIDPNTLRGCAIALSQVWDWLVEKVPEIETIAPPPDWSEWVGAIRQRLQTCFDVGVFSQLFTMYDCLPKSLAVEIAKTDPATLGERAVETLLNLAKGAVRQLIERGREERTLARTGMLAAMNQAVLLCFDPARLPRRLTGHDGSLGPIVEVDATSVASAALATGLARYECWDVGVDDVGMPCLMDRNAYSFKWETGGRNDFKRELSVFIHQKAYNRPIPLPELNERALARMRSNLRREAKDGRAHLVVVDQEQSWEDFRPDLEDWLLNELGTSLLLCRTPEGYSAAHYLCDENDVLTAVRSFVSLLSQPPWTTS